MRLAPFILILVLFTGCTVYYPHTTVRAEAISGTVVDASTHTPIVGAKVFRTKHPEIVCNSGSDGRFKLKELRNWHYGMECDPGGGYDVPMREYWFGRNITILQTNYLRCPVDLDTNHGDTVFLTKPGEVSSQTHLWLLFNGSGSVLQDMGATGYLKPGSIHIIDRLKNNVEDRPLRLQIEFVRRVYNPWITAVDQPDDPRLTPNNEKALVWDFGIEYRPSQANFGKGDFIEDSSRVYRLDFIP